MEKKGKPDSTPTDLRGKTPGVGRTEQSREQGVEPRLPHERDESADSQGSHGPTAGEPFNEDIGEKAFEDLKSGRRDTGRLPVTDEVYEGLKDEKGAGSQEPTGAQNDKPRRGD